MRRHPYVRQELVNWTKWLLERYSAHLLRMDASAHINPEFFPFYQNATKMPLWLETVADPWDYERARQGANYSYQSFSLYNGTVTCFAPEAPNGDSTTGCYQISLVRERLQALGADTRLMGTFVENHDTDRFLSASYYGAEQAMGRNNTGSAWESANRKPLWETGFDVSSPMYTFIRTMAWYRFWLNVTQETQLEHYMDRSTYAFSHGPSLLAVLTAGAPPGSTATPAERYPQGHLMTNLTHMAGKELCDALRSGYCVRVSANGTASVAPSPTDEPLILVPRQWLKPASFFVPIPAREAQWRRGLAVTLSTIFGAVLLGLLGLSSLRGTGDAHVVTGPAGACKPALHHSDSAGSTKLGSSGSSKLDASDSGALAIDLEAGCGPVPSGKSASRPGPATSPATATRAGSMGRAAALAAPRSALLAQMQSPFEAQAGVEFAAAAAWAAACKGSSDASEDRITAAHRADSRRSGSGLRFSSKFDSALDAVERGGLSAVPQSPKSGKPIQLRPVGSLDVCDSLGLPIIDSLPMEPSPVMDWSLEGLESFKAHNAHVSAVHELVDALQSDSRLVMHVCLEYSVPHLGLNSELMFGGLGKVWVVDSFIRNTTRPMLLCAPMYAPFYGPEGGSKPRLFREPPIATFPAFVGGTKHLVDVYLTSTAAPSGGKAKVTAGAQAGQTPPTFFLLLASPVFQKRTRSTIYTHASEEEELTFFSVFNQAVAHVVQTLGVRSLQLHDYHGALSIAYLPPQIPVRAMLVAHNADYNGSWPVWTKSREAWVYAMFNLPLNEHTRSLCEHEGCFNMLRPLLTHMCARQGGKGVVAVSPRYAQRCVAKFSMFWQLPHGAQGILNGMEEDCRPQLALDTPAELDAFFASKLEAKLAYQAAKGLQVGAEHKLIVFLGRITHQKGCDLIALAARDILKGNRHAQIVMAGPIGDEYGEQARTLLEKGTLSEVVLAHDFPGRVVNAAGQYVAGAEKEQLILATDFFLCPSRFEPCGLADIEFGWLGAVQIGHHTGGLGKMPGFYYRAPLDCREDQAIRLARVTLKALSMPAAELRRLAEAALRTEFPPHVQMARYERAWARLHSCSRKQSAAKAAVMEPGEAQFFGSAWLEDNTPYDPNTSAERQAVKRQRERRAWLHNGLIIAMQAVLQLPSLLCLLWYSSMALAGNIRFEASTSAATIATSPTSIYFYAYSLSAVACQTIGFLVPPLLYMRLAAAGLVISTLCMLWSLWLPSAAQALYLATSAGAAAWSPLLAYPFLDMSHISMSQHGPLLMGVSDVLSRATSVAAVWAMLRNGQGATDFAGFEAAGVVLLIAAVWFVMWLGQRSPLPAHFCHFRLRLRGQLSTLLRQRRCWLLAVCVTTLDSFAGAALLSIIYKIKSLEDTQLYLLAFALTSLGAAAGASALLMSRLGRRLGLRLMYCLAALPGVVVAQGILILYGGSAGLWIAATLLGSLYVRQSLVGLLTLHTLPTRETYALVRTLQVVLGSLAIVAGLALGGSGLGGGLGWTLGGIYEAARLLLVAAVIVLHCHENIASP
ncbi:hypothetical protein COHA_001031 [Chlorella ohadii]|uniref:Uncharacterized protein n=1 Tax=Chlorella ohadii TaxID=2649997 RepID=A0AAD5DZA3_9CHLO|nr:hypothetical protein COHA_001031 [Chlorella ohadii]